MKILWLMNIMLPYYAKEKGLPYSEREGWLSGAFAKMMQEADPNLQLAICFPTTESGKKEILNGTFFYSFHEDLRCPERYDPELETQLADILKDYQPDLVHIFGTEFPHTLAMSRAFKHPDRMLIGIQGACAECAAVYKSFLPDKVWNTATFRDRVRHDSLKKQQQKFEKRAAHEREALSLTGHVAGRTDFDRAFLAQNAPNASYHYLCETMRPIFYQGHWDVGRMERHRIFVSQGDYPLKGFHILLRALPSLIKEYPDLEVYCAGNNIFRTDRKLSALRISAYGEYLRQLAHREQVAGHVHMIGTQDAEGILKQLEQANVFVCPSVLENSPNALAEAMLAGVPVVAAAVGGIPSMLEQEKEGLLFEGGDVRELARSIKRIFDNDTLAASLGGAASKRAHVVHDPDEGYRQLKRIYKEMMERKLPQTDASLSE